MLDHTMLEVVLNSSQILEAFHHPYYATGRSEIQNKMYDHMERWINGLGSDSREILNSLTKVSRYLIRKNLVSCYFAYSGKCPRP